MLAAGDRVGPYEVISSLGSGGMGWVYRARDVRLDREVALKVLHEKVSRDCGGSRRFENEAKSASALNHPNIITIYDVGTSDELSWIAMERVKGATLRDALSGDPLGIKKLLNIASQIADGLATAHDAGIVHRDLKPENVMLTRDEQVKIVDFGLAKLNPTGPATERGSPATETFPGTVLGTVGYMSPEQASGQPADFRSDQFSFGSILYEMATGARAFQKKTSVETLTAILNEDPRALGEINPEAPVPLRWIVERCLAKDPDRRYASTRDLARDLEVLRGHVSEAASLAVSRRPSSLRSTTWLAPLALFAGFVGVFLLGRRAGDRQTPDFQRLTYRRGNVLSARFAPDGRTVVYGAAWEGGPIRLFSTRTDGRDSTALDCGDADLASISSLGEIGMLLGRPFEPESKWVGTLARAPLTGGAPREMTEGVSVADWSPDGRSLAFVRKVGEKYRLEFPTGKVLFETSGFIESLRVSPQGDRVAFAVRGSGVSVDVVDLSGRHKVLSGGWKRHARLAWSPDGQEIWFTVNDREWKTPLRAVTPSGKLRLLMRLPPFFDLDDVSRDGRALISIAGLRWSTVGRSAGETRERDLSWHEGTLVKSMTPDGKTLLFDEGSEGFFHTVYVRPMDGSPAKRLGEGRSLAISPDGQWVAANTRGRGSPVVLMPTGAGEPKPVEGEGHRFEEAAFFSDGKRLLLVARDPGHRDRSYVKDLDTGTLRPIAPEGASCRTVSSDGKDVACVGPSGKGAVYPVEGGEPRPIPGLLKGEEAVLWSSDGRSIFVSAAGFVPTGEGASLEVFRLELATGRRELWHAFTPADRAGVVSSSYNFALTPDGQSYAFSTMNVPSDLYLVSGIR